MEQIKQQLIRTIDYINIVELLECKSINDIVHLLNRYGLEDVVVNLGLIKPLNAPKCNEFIKETNDFRKKYGDDRKRLDTVKLTQNDEHPFRSKEIDIEAIDLFSDCINYKLPECINLIKYYPIELINIYIPKLEIKNNEFSFNYSLTNIIWDNYNDEASCKRYHFNLNKVEHKNLNNDALKYSTQPMYLLSENNYRVIYPTIGIPETMTGILILSEILLNHTNFFHFTWYNTHAMILSKHLYNNTYSRYDYTDDLANLTNDCFKLFKLLNIEYYSYSIFCGDDE